METFATEKKQTEKKFDPKQLDASPVKKFSSLLDEDEIEISKLTEDDLQDTVKVMRKCAFDVTDGEVKSIIKYSMSYGAYVNRMLIGVGLSWPAKFDYDDKLIKGGTPNALYIEDPAILLAYEGRGIRRMLLKEREKEAGDRSYKYAMAYLYEDIPKGDISHYIREAGSQLEKLFLSENYEFYRTDKGILTLKRV